MITNNNLLSTIGTLNAQGPKCVIPTNGGECQITLLMPENKKIENAYSIDLITKKTISNYTTQKTLTPIDKKVFYKTTNTGKKEKNTLYLYQLPNDYKEVEKINFLSELKNTKIIINSDSKSKLSLYNVVGVINGLYNKIIVCEKPSCESDYVVKSYVSDDGYNVFRMKNSEVLSSDNIYSSESVGSQEKDLLVNTTYDGGVINKTFFDLVIERSIDPDNKYSFSYEEPLLKTAYQKKHSISELSVFVGDKKIGFFKNISGRIYLPDISNVLNDYCHRTNDYNSADSECLIPLRFVGDDGGEVIILNELGELESFESLNVANKITLNISKNDYLVFGVLVLLTGLILLVIKKKRWFVYGYEWR